MQIRIEVVSVLFSLNCIYPVLTHYIYDDNPIAGYVSNDIGNYPKSRISGHKKYLVSGNNQKNMKLVNERAVDSHFKISKASPVSFAIVPNMESRHIQKVRKVTESPPQKSLADINSVGQKMIINNDIQIPEQLKASKTNDVEKHINEGLFKPNVRNYFDNRNVISKPQNNDVSSRHTSNVLVDVQKKLSKLNNRRLEYPQQNYYQKPLTSSVKDKVIHKANINNEQNAQLMTYMLNEIAQKFIDRKSQKQAEYRKRDALSDATVYHGTVNPQEDKAGSSKYFPKSNIGSSLKSGVKRDRVIQPGSSSYDMGVEVNDTPYALFYRMNHENIEQSDFFTSAEARTTVEDAVNDKNRIAMSYGEEPIRGYRRSVNTKNKSNVYAAFRDR